MQSYDYGGAVMKAVFEIAISYAQICVFRPSLANPYNDWRPAHYEQGFSWREESVSFAVPQDGRCQVTLTDAETDTDGANVLRCVKTPFVSADAEVEIGSITDTNVLNVPPATYQITFILRRSDDSKYKFLIELVLQQSAHPTFAVLKADALMNVPKEFLLHAAPA